MSRLICKGWKTGKVCFINFSLLHHVKKSVVSTTCLISYPNGSIENANYCSPFTINYFSCDVYTGCSFNFYVSIIVKPSTILMAAA